MHKSGLKLKKPTSKSKIVEKKFGGALRGSLSKVLKKSRKKGKPIRKLSPEEIKKRDIDEMNRKAKVKTKTTPKVKAPKAIGASKKARKAIGKKAADLQTPAAVATPGSGQILRSGGPKPNVGGIRESAVISKQMNQKGKTLTKKINELKKLEQETASLTGAARGKHMVETAEKKKLLKAAIQDMKRRDITPKRGGGKVSYRAKGGKSMPISTTGKHGGKKQMVRGSDDHLFLPPFSKTKEEKKLSAMPGWMKGLSPDQIKQILGGPTRDASGVTRHSKKATSKKKKTVKAKGGGKVVYRKVSGKVLDGNDIIKMIYDKQI